MYVNGICLLACNDIDVLIPYFPAAFRLIQRSKLYSDYLFAVLDKPHMSTSGLTHSFDFGNINGVTSKYPSYPGFESVLSK